MSTLSQNTSESLLTGLTDLQFSLNDSLRIASLTAESPLMRELSRDALIGRPWLELVSEADRAQAASCLETAAQQPGAAQKIDLRMDIVPDQEPVPITCWVCGDSDDKTLRIACIDLRSESNLRQQLVNAQRTLEQDYWSNRRLEARYRRSRHVPF